MEIKDKAKAQELADLLRAEWPDKAAEIDAAIARSGGNAEVGDPGFKIDVSIKFKLEKFHGDKKPGDVPFETIEGTG